MELENLILENLLHNDQYNRKVIPFLKAEYFERASTQQFFKLIEAYFTKYNSFPNKEALNIELNAITDISQETFNECRSLIGANYPAVETEWIVDKTEEWCQNRALENALRQAIRLADKEDDKSQLTKGAIPQILSDALAVSFDTVIGHDYLDDATERWDYYHLKEKKFPFDIDLLNSITNGGVTTKTLNVIMAGVGVGKSLGLCHLAAQDLMRGFNVLYITLELKKEEVARRIDANMMDVALDDIMILPKSTFLKNVERLKGISKGKLIIKEYPQGSVNANHFKHLIHEIKMKKSVKIDVVYIDYINLCASSRLRDAAGAGMYYYVKSVAEEMRGIGQEYDIPVWSATQVNRQGFNNSDFGMEHTSESFGLPATCDLLLALILTEELDQLGQMMIKQLKNRYGDLNKNNRFVIGVDRPKMRWYNLEQSGQTNIIKDTVVFDSSKFAEDSLNSKFEDFLI